MKENEMASEIEKLEIVEILKGARKVNFNQILQNEYDFFVKMKDKFGVKDQKVKECETRLRDLISVFADAANVAFPENTPINSASIGLVNQTLSDYTWTVLVSKS